MPRGRARSRSAAWLALPLAGLLFVSFPNRMHAGPPCECGDAETCDGELCDDGNTESGDGCSFPSCLPEICGDDILNPDPAPGPAEQCDDGNTDPNDGCDANCQLECGNGTLEGAETCDDSGESATCDDDCTFGECGDGNLNETAGEFCDDGNTIDGDGCEADCSNRGIVTRAQQRCINAVNKNLAGVARAQGAEISKCVTDAAKGAPATCFVAGAKTTRAGDKTTETVTGEKCTQEPPSIAFTNAATVNAAGSDSLLEGAETILGATPMIAPKATDKAGATCQAEAMKRYSAIAFKWLAEANKAKKTSMKGGKRGSPAPAGSPTELAAGIDAEIDGNVSISKAVTKAAMSIAKKCEGVDIDPLFECGGASDAAALSACIASEAARAACQALEAADLLDLNCP